MIARRGAAGFSRVGFGKQTAQKEPPRLGCRRTYRRQFARRHTVLCESGPGLSLNPHVAIPVAGNQQTEMPKVLTLSFSSDFGSFCGTIIVYGVNSIYILQTHQINDLSSLYCRKVERKAKRAKRAKKEKAKRGWSSPPRRKKLELSSVSRRWRGN